MLVAVDQIELLRLHVDGEGQVWFGDDTQLGTPSGMEADPFFASDVLAVPWEKVRKVRLLGVPSNSRLICNIQQARAANPALVDKQLVMVGSPMVAGNRTNDPAVVLQAMWQREAVGTLKGYWHRMGPFDFVAHAMLSETAKAGEVTELVRRTVRYHPAWAALSFVDSLDESLACRLVNEIVDPRFFIHPERPDRLSRLYAYLGLTPKNVTAVIEGGRKDRNCNRASLAIRAWYNPGLRPSAVPRNFLFRTYTGGDCRAKGILRATQRFVALVAMVWKGQVERGHPEIGFRPDMFFHAKDEVAAFEQHRLAVRKV